MVTIMAGESQCHCLLSYNLIGWSKHPVCGRRYHFIIQNEYDVHEYKTCKHCGHMAQLLEMR
jgi:hypothetical protein